MVDTKDFMALYEKATCNSEAIGDRIYRLRMSRKPAPVSQETLAFELGVSQKTISNIEHGETSINANGLIRLSAFFNVPVEYILFGKDDVWFSIHQEDFHNNITEILEIGNELIDCGQDLVNLGNKLLMNIK